MTRRLALLVFVIFLGFTGAYVFVYLGRAFRIEGPADTVVRIWHGDDFVRSLLMAIFFLIGLTILGFTWLAVTLRRREGNVQIRGDLLEWLTEEGRETHEPPSVVAERAISSYRARLEGELRGRQVDPDA